MPSKFNHAIGLNSKVPTDFQTFLPHGTHPLLFQQLHLMWIAAAQLHAIQTKKKKNRRQEQEEKGELRLSLVWEILLYICCF